VVSVLVQGAQSECAPCTRAVKTTFGDSPDLHSCRSEEEVGKRAAAQPTAALLQDL
jgi:hypothetical protein